MKELNIFLDKNKIDYEKNVSFKELTSYKAGGKTLFLVKPKDIKELITVLKYLKGHNITYKILGNGTNTLFSDNLFKGVILKLSNFQNIIYIGETTLIAETGVSLTKLALDVSKKGLAGLEFAPGIPGTIGGALFMNAGAYKSDMGYIVKRATVLTPDYKIITMTNEELDFHYRTSFFKKNPGYIIINATISLYKGDKKALESVISDRLLRRRSSQPLEYPSAGSVFKNPPLLSAGKLIDDLGLKGYKIGGAEVSEKHANFIINKNNAHGEDIKNLIYEVKRRVKESYQIDLELEQELVNFDEKE